MKFHVLTIFPDFVASVFQFGVVRRGVEAGLIEPHVHDLRDWTTDRHRSTDDMPFGGGPGMVMRCEPIFSAVESLRAANPAPLPLVYTSPAGEPFNQRIAEELANGPDLLLLCGRYEGVDQRVLDNLVDREISMGDYVLSGGELPVMCLVDAVSRLIPGVVGDSQSVHEESFTNGMLDWPHYTRPESYRELSVPEVLLSGHHANIDSWRHEQALLMTYRRRPELLTQEQRERAKQILGL
ncbi:MAG: tRNA (guanosine(37)-N1)-methyltransferase TrmD [Planctomycetales bacterium]|nr:tRNA (guanosine(37)-N1)-methyltransferase TrmD [bacterium]UNM08364.1 MAG: tRNA (guanosine(37)-N1)-methyltransferase TrmD [Planctomycetales bacterium]